jgi:hypothetical protein
MSKTEAYQKSEELLRKLVTLPNESEEADKIRDECDVYWYKLTEEEKQELRELSNSLGD